MQPGQAERLGQVSSPDDTARRKRVPGYPQDMVMFMDKEVAKPQTYGLPPGWAGSFMGMMTMVRVLPPAFVMGWKISVDSGVECRVYTRRVE